MRKILLLMGLFLIMATPLYAATSIFSDDVHITDDANFGDDVTVVGDLTINGQLTCAELFIYDSQITSPMVQYASLLTKSVVTITTDLPADNSIPQNNEGEEIGTLSITPKNATNLLVIDVSVYCENSNTSGVVTVALFQDTTAGALAATGVASVDNYPMTIPLHYEMTAGTTSETTFKVRVGDNGAGTVTINGDQGATTYGGVESCSIRIQELLA